MCDAISGYIEVESGAILAAHPASHSGTAEALGLKLDQRERYSEWEWPAIGELIVRHTDAETARRLVSSITARFPTREALMAHCRPQWERAGNYLIESQADADRIPADVPGDVICTLATALDLPALTSIGGYLYAPAATALDLPALTSIGGGLSALAATALDLPALTSIGGDLYAPAATADAGRIRLRISAAQNGSEARP